MWYALLEKFGPECGNKWISYIEWSGLKQLTQFRSLDGILSPSLWNPQTEEDWRYSVNQDYRCHLMTDFRYARLQASKYPNGILYGVIANPITIEKSPLANHKLLGFELLDRSWGVSALTNCGGFPDVFSNQEISENGLILTLERAQSIQRGLIEMHPEESHADCDIWAVYEVIAYKKDP